MASLRIVSCLCIYGVMFSSNVSKRCTVILKSALNSLGSSDCNSLKRLFVAPRAVRLNIHVLVQILRSSSSNKSHNSLTRSREQTYYDVVLINCKTAQRYATSFRNHWYLGRTLSDVLYKNKFLWHMFFVP